MTVWSEEKWLRVNVFFDWMGLYKALLDEPTVAHRRVFLALESVNQWRVARRVDTWVDPYVGNIAGAPLSVSVESCVDSRDVY